MTYQFTEDAPSNHGKAAFETAGIKAYVNRGGKCAVETKTAAGEPARRPWARAGGAEAVAARGAISSPEAPAASRAARAVSRCSSAASGSPAWQGLEIGYEVDVVLEVPAGKEEAAPACGAAAVAPAAPASSVEKRVWLAKPVASVPRGRRQTRSARVRLRGRRGLRDI